MNRAFGGVKDIIVDPDRAPLVQEMFQQVATEGHSGRMIKRWLDSSGFTTRQNKSITISLIYLMLRNPFYYGQFKFPTTSDIWYQGKHTPLISKDLFDQVQKQLKTHPQAPWGSKKIIYKGLFKCGSCGVKMIGEEKYRKRKYNPPNHHVYYHCARQMGQCREPYIEEKKLEKQVLRYINFLSIAHQKELQLSKTLKASISTYRSVRDEILYEQDVFPEDKPLNIVDFARYIFYSGSLEEKRDLIMSLDKQLYIKNGYVSANMG